MKPAPFDYVLARSAAEAIDLLARRGDEAKVLAGGQSLVPMLNLRLARPAVVVDINGAAELDYLRETDGVLTVGALVRQHRLERWATARAPLFAEALRFVGHMALRTRGTVAGSVVHADPASELPALLVGLDGSVVARSQRGERVILARALYVAPLTTALAPDECCTEVRFRLPPAGAGWGFAEVARRHGDFALVGAISVLACDASRKVSEARLAFFGAGPTPVRAETAEAMLAGHEPTPARIREAAQVASRSLSPDSDLHATADYRRTVAAVLAERTLNTALARAEARAS